MHFSKSLTLLAALTSSAVARHGHNARHESHLRRQDTGSTVTLTTTNTVYVCPCDSSTSTSLASISTPFPATTSTSTVALTTSPSTSTSMSTSDSTSTSISTFTSTSTSSSTSTEVTTSTIASSTSTTAASTTSSGASADWSSVPSSGEYCTDGFGASTKSSGSGDSYVGNVGSPYGSNIIEVSSSEASSYKYVVQFQGSNTDDWEVVIWNKIGPDGKMDGWYGNACHSFTLAAGATKYYAFAADSQGGWTAAKDSIPTNSYGSYASTWGEFDFGSTANSGWSGFDVSAIQAQNAGLTVQGMQICSALSDGTCSAITKGAATVSNAYTAALADKGGIGGNLIAGPVRLAVTLDYCG